MFRGLCSGAFLTTDAAQQAVSDLRGKVGNASVAPNLGKFSVGEGDHMIVSVFVRRLKPGATFQDFVREWEADEGFGVPTRVFNAQSLTDPREIISIGFAAVTADQATQWLATAPASETVRHERIDTVIESTTLRCMYDLRTEHDFSHLPQQIDIGSPPSLLAALISG